MKIKLIVLFVLSFTNLLFAQRYKVLEGKLKNLEGITSYNVEFNYDKLQVHGYDSENDFLKDKIEKRKSDPEKAEKFEKDWFENREKYYHPEFITFFNDFFKGEECKITDNALHIMKINIVWLYPGYLVEPAKMSVIIDFYDVNNPSQKLLSIQFEKVIGFEKNAYVGKEYDRIIGAYKKLAKNLGMQIKRVL